MLVLYGLGRPHSALCAFGLSRRALPQIIVPVETLVTEVAKALSIAWERAYRVPKCLDRLLMTGLERRMEQTGPRPRTVSAGSPRVNVIFDGTSRTLTVGERHDILSA